MESDEVKDEDEEQEKEKEEELYVNEELTNGGELPYLDEEIFFLGKQRRVKISLKYS